jgi:hypothetical protein
MPLSGMGSAGAWNMMNGGFGAVPGTNGGYGAFGTGATYGAPGTNGFVGHGANGFGG